MVTNRSRIGRPAIAIVVCFALIAAACSGDDDEQTEVSETTSVTVGSSSDEEPPPTTDDSTVDDVADDEPPETSTTADDSLESEPASVEPFPLRTVLYEPMVGESSFEVFDDPAAGVDPAAWQTSRWMGHLRLEHAFTPRSDATASGDIVIAQVDGRDAIAIVNDSRAFLGWYLVDAGEIGIILDLDGDGGVDFAEVLHDDLTKSWVLSPLGRSFAVAIEAGRPFGLCDGDPTVDITGLDVIGLPCVPTGPGAEETAGLRSVGASSIRLAQQYDDWTDFQAANSCALQMDPIDRLRADIGQERIDAANRLRADLDRYGGETVFNVAFFSTYVFEWMKFSPPQKTGNPLNDWLRDKAIDEFGGEKGVEKLQGLTSSEILRLATRTLPDLVQETADATLIQLALAGAPRRTCDERDPDGQQKNGNGGGDPHIRTFDGLSYSYQGVGDYTVLVSDDGSFEIQARTQPLGRSASAFDVIAVRFDESVVRFVRARTGVEDGGRFVASGATDGSLVMTDSEVALPDGTVVEVEQNGPALSVSIDLSPVWQNRVLGWFGDADGSPDDDLVARNTDTPIDVEDLYAAWGESWRVDAETSFLPYGDGEDPEDFHDRSFPSVEVDIDDATMAEARRRCAARGVLVDPDSSQCAFDLAVTNDESFLDDAAGRAAANGQVLSVPTAPIVDLTPDIGGGFGIIEGYGRYEVWRLEVGAGERIDVVPLVDRFIDCSLGPWNLAALVYFAAPDGTPLTEPSSLGDNCNRFNLAHEVTTSGEVLLVVAGQPLLDARAQGPYGLAVHRAEPDQIASVSTPFDTDELPGFGVFETAGSVERFRFDVEAGDEIHIQPRSVDGKPCSIGPGPGYVLQMFDPAGEPLVEGSSAPIDGASTWYWTNNCRYHFLDPLVITATRTGTHELVVGSRPVFGSSRTGSFEIRVAIDPRDLA